MTEKPGEKAAEEVSAGGVVLDAESRILMVKVRNLQGLIVWTFPKGHLEKGETAEQAALREVLEETGWECRMGKPFWDVKYSFQREGRLIHKTVHWFLMEPVAKRGESDPKEIMESRWMGLDEASSLLVYKSDKEIMARVRTIV